LKPGFLILVFYIFLNAPCSCFGQSKEDKLVIDFYGDSIPLKIYLPVIGPAITSLSDSAIQSFYNRIENDTEQTVVKHLLDYKEKHQLDDWLYYQLIRATAERITPKAANYQRYTLYKWYLLVKSGYATTISIRNDRLLLYIQSNDEVFNIPFRMQDGKQYICLNYHDYRVINFEKEPFTSLNISIPGAKRAFSYRVSRLPDFKSKDYAVKELQFEYYQTAYHFKVMLNNQIKKVFKNYPVVDYQTFFNIPLSQITYRSLIPLLRENTSKMSKKDGIDYLMRFTRYAFAYQTDTKVYGEEKRLSPEQTLLSDNSDCEDRAALFFYLVKEIYDLPMIVLSYPEHITIAVEFDQPGRDPIKYNGKNYWICEPTPQGKDLPIGQSLPSLRKVSYDVVYAYNPLAKQH